jgi:hypothetical protein
MNEAMIKRNDLLAETVLKGLKSRNMSGYYAHTKEEALKIALELIPEGSDTWEVVQPVQRSGRDRPRRIRIEDMKPAEQQ